MHIQLLSYFPSVFFHVVERIFLFRYRMLIASNNGYWAFADQQMGNDRTSVMAYNVEVLLSMHDVFHVEFSVQDYLAFNVLFYQDQAQGNDDVAST